MSRPRVGGGVALPSSPLIVEGLSGGAGEGRAKGHAPPERLQALQRFRHLAREGAGVLRASRVGIWQFPEGEEGLRCLTRFHGPEAGHEDDRLYSWELARAFRFLLERVSMVAVDDTLRSRGTSQAVREWLEAEEIRSLLVLPVRIRGGLTGCVTFEEVDEPRVWTERDRDLATALAHQVSGILAEEPLAPAPSGNGRPEVDETGPPIQQASAHHVSTRQAGTRERSLDSAPIPEVRKELRARLRRLPPLEGAAVLAGESVEGLLHLLEIQEGYLALLDDAVVRAPGDRKLLEEARALGEQLRDGLLGFLQTLREGVPGRHPLDLSAFLAGISGDLARMAGEGVRLRLAPASGILRVQGNSELLERAMIHLIRNAREASEPGSTIRISWGRWALAESPDSEPWMARIVVEDQGAGISPENLPWIFEPFFTTRDGEKSTDRTEASARGLGLSVVQAVVEGHGGWVEVRSRVGAGTQVQLHLPLALPTPPSPREEDGGEAALSPEGRGKGRILLVEDDPLLSRLLERILTRNGFQVELVEAAEEADRHWRRLNGEVDLVIVERTLTGDRKGTELVQPWRREAPGLGVLVLDRRAQPSREEDRIREASDGLPLLTRPFVPADVLAQVRRALPDRSEGREAPTPPPGVQDSPLEEPEGGGPILH